MSMTKEMTAGKPYKLILSFAWPLILGNVFQQLYNMVDTIIVGKYVGVNALAAVGSTGAINFLVIGFALGICSGFSIMISQSFGAGNYSEMRKYVANSVYLSAAAAVILTVSTMLLTGPILKITNTPDEIYDEAYHYIIVIFAGISATIFYNMLAGILRALGDSKSPLIFLGISSVLNIILDLTLIIVFRMGVFGAALATVVAQGISAVLCLIYIIKKFDILKFEKSELRFDTVLSGKLISVGVPMALQFSITAIGTIILQAAVNSLGTSSVAAVTAASKIQTVVTGPMESMGIAMATYCGQNKGAGKYERIRTGIKQSVLMSVGYCIAACVAVAVLGGAMTSMFIDKKSTDPAELAKIIELSKYYLILNGVFYPALGILFILRNSLQGMGYSFLPMMAGVSELAARSLVVFLFISSFGYTAACLASPVAWIFADVLLVITYAVKMRSMKNEAVFQKKEAVA
ncbi:MATE family efflux transporter [Porcipelethomonas sp.]|uniref:MATE family efflux transporter n=1 Tax=Porcipelethomonas sp. TaxID=2981675 RepID=UPI003EFA0AED